MDVFCAWVRVFHFFGFILISGAVFQALSAVADSTNRDPVLELLLKKGVISEDEVQKAQGQIDEMRSNNYVNAMPPIESKWRIGKSIKNLEIYGDLRLRYEHREATAPDDSRIELERLRYSARLGLRGEVFDDFYYGVRLDTGANPRSAWVTAATSASGTPYQGPFGKSNAGINVGQVYIGWRPEDWVDLTFGKFANPIYTTPMIWDSDINPEGFAERFKYTIGQADFIANFGQFLYQDTNPTHSSEGFFNVNHTSSSPAFLLAWQLGINYRFTEDLSFKVAPVLYNYIGHGANGTAPGAPVAPDFSGTYVGQGAATNIAGTAGGAWSGFPGGFYDGFTANQTGINDLLVVDIPWEVNWKINKLNTRLFGDYAQNLNGNQRAEAAFNASTSNGRIAPISSPQTDENKAYQIGLAFVIKDSLGMVNGSTCRRHAWELRGYWQHIEQYALDPNLIDSDYFEGRENMEGVFGALGYGLTDNVLATVRYGYARRINKNLGTGGSNQDIPQINPIEHYNILQFDLSFRF